MRDYVFVLYLVLLFCCGLRRPFLFVLGYVYIDIVSPQRLSYYLLASVPISLIFFVGVVLGWIVADTKGDTRVAFRQILLVALLGWAGWTTLTADFPIDAAEKWDWVWKTLVFAIFLPFTLRTRLRIEALVTVMILSASSIIIIGGIKTLFSGGGYGTLNLGLADNSGLYEGSTISTVAIAIIPMILFVMRFGTIFARDWRLKLFGWALIFACLLIPIGTEARTGLICIAVLAMLMLRNTKRRLLYLTGLGLAAAIALPLLPSSFGKRMETIQGYQGDQSASTRLAVWGWTLDYVKDHPFGGGFGAYRQNRLSFQTKSVGGTGAVVVVEQKDAARAWHSAYFEMLGEQGWLGLGLWVSLHLAGLVRMEVLRQRYRRAVGDEAWIPHLAAALQSADLIYLVGALFVGIAFQSVPYMWIGLQIGLSGYCLRKQRAAAGQGWSRRSRASAAQAAAPALTPSIT